MFRFSKHFLAEPSNKLLSERSGTGFPREEQVQNSKEGRGGGGVPLD